MILGVHHPALSVPDMEQAIEFYCGKLGFEPVMEIELPSGIEMMSRAFDLEDAGYKVAMLRKGNSCIELFEFTGENVPQADPNRPVDRIQTLEDLSWRRGLGLGRNHGTVIRDDLLTPSQTLIANKYLRGTCNESLD